MSKLKKLAGQTVLYGLSSIVGRLLNYLLVPIYTGIFIHTADYGVVSELYAYVAFLLVFLTFGMETTFFRFLHLETDKNQVFNNAFISVLAVNVGFLIILFAFQSAISGAMLYADHPAYIILLGLIVATDAVSSLPLAKLRAEERAKRFVFVQLSSIITNIGLNLILLFCFFDPQTDPASKGILFIFIANLISSLIKPLLLIDILFRVRFHFDFHLAKKMLRYAWPILIAGFAGIINEVLDRILLKQLLDNKASVPSWFQGSSLRYAESQVGIYSANYKLAMLISIFLQAFRYAAEPFFFSHSGEEDRNTIYSKIMTYLVAILALCFLCISLNLDIFKHFIRNEAYYEGLKVVPILLVGNIFLGIYMNQSIWYKLSGQTKFGAYISIVGACFTIILLTTLIPTYGYIAAAWTTTGVYGAQMLASYFLGQKHYPIHYDVKKTGFYFLLSILFFFAAKALNFSTPSSRFLIHNGFILTFMLIFLLLEKPFKKSGKALA